MTILLDGWDDGEDTDRGRSLDAEHDAWLARWAPRCPDHRLQRVRRCLGYREREPGRLQLRVALSGGEGVCEVPFEQDDDAVRVRLLVCSTSDGDPRDEYTNCPVHIYLARPLGDRPVIDVHTDEPVPLFVPCC